MQNEIEKIYLQWLPAIAVTVILTIWLFFSFVIIKIFCTDNDTDNRLQSENTVIENRVSDIEGIIICNADLLQAIEDEQQCTARTIARIESILDSCTD